MSDYDSQSEAVRKAYIKGFNAGFDHGLEEARREAGESPTQELEALKKLYGKASAQLGRIRALARYSTSIYPPDVNIESPAFREKMFVSFTRDEEGKWVNYQELTEALEGDDLETGGCVSCGYSPCMCDQQ